MRVDYDGALTLSGAAESPSRGRTMQHSCARNGGHSMLKWSRVDQVRADSRKRGAPRWGILVAGNRGRRVLEAASGHVMSPGQNERVAVEPGVQEK
jgi:hypothetical protein